MSEQDWEILTQLTSTTPNVPEDTLEKFGESTLAWRQAIVETILKLQRDVHLDLLNINRRIDNLP